MVFACGAGFALAGCTAVDTTGTERAMWGPCRGVALQRQEDERIAGYDAETLKRAMALTYDDCVWSERRLRVQSIYDDPAPMPRLPATKAAPAGAIRSSLLPIKPEE